MFGIDSFREKEQAIGAPAQKMGIGRQNTSGSVTMGGLERKDPHSRSSREGERGKRGKRKKLGRGPKAGNPKARVGFRKKLGRNMGRGEFSPAGILDERCLTLKTGGGGLEGNSWS